MREKGGSVEPPFSFVSPSQERTAGRARAPSEVARARRFVPQRLSAALRDASAQRARRTILAFFLAAFFLTAFLAIALEGAEQPSTRFT